MPRSPGTRKLSLTLVDVDGEAQGGVEVQVEVPTAKVAPIPGQTTTGMEIAGSTVTRHTNIDGVTFFYLYPSEFLRPAGTRYSIRWSGRSGVSFAMPDRDTDFYDLPEAG